MSLLPGEHWLCVALATRCCVSGNAKRPCARISGSVRCVPLLPHTRSVCASAFPSTRCAPRPGPIRSAPVSPSSCEYNVCPTFIRGAPVSRSLLVRGGTPKTRTVSARRSSRVRYPDAALRPLPHPPHAVGRRAISLVSLLPFSLTGTEKARKPGRRRKVPQRLRSRARAAAASAPPPGAARPPASQRPGAQLARDSGVSDPAWPCPALPPRALTAASASPCSTGPEPGAGGRERRGGAARDALFLPEPGQLPSSPCGSGRSRARGSPSR